jgi:hypothetical protein
VAEIVNFISPFTAGNVLSAVASGLGAVDAETEGEAVTEGEVETDGEAVSAGITVVCEFEMII